MTGNTSKWRAPLAGLASIAMLATMGLVASTANAAGFESPKSDYKVNVYDASKPYQKVDQYTRGYGQIVKASDVDLYAKKHKVLDYLSYDKDGNNKVETPYVVTGDVKLYAHSKDAVKVSFDVNNNGITDAGDKSIVIAKGSSLTYDEYLEAFGSGTGVNAGGVQEPVDTSKGWFVGWTQTRSASGTGTSDLYQGGAITADTTLYPRFDKGDNLAQVDFQEQGKTSNVVTRYTLNNTAFPEYRVPLTWTTTDTTKFVDGAFAGWTGYNFSDPILNSNADGVDKIVIASKSNSLVNVTVNYNFDGAYATIGDKEGTTSISKAESTFTGTPTEPVAPVKAGYVFNGWWVKGTGTKVDFSKPFSEQKLDASSNTLNLVAKWDSTHAAQLVFNLGYESGDFSGTPKQVLYVYAGSDVTLPAGLEEYYQTPAQFDADKDEYTSRVLSGWYEGDDTKQVVTAAKAPNATTTRSYTAAWNGSESLNLNANGGTFDGAVTNKWVTKSDSQKWQDVVVEPTRDGYYFAGWSDRASGASGKTANLSDGYWYTTDSAGKPVRGTSIANGSQLYAQWTDAGTDDINAAFVAYPLNGATAPEYVPSFKNKQADYALYAKYAKSEAGWKAYVDTVYGLKDDFNAISALSGQEKLDAKKALAAKLQAAQEKLTDFVNPKGEVTVFRLFNPNETRAGSHFYTASVVEYNSLVRKGWNAEGVAFVTSEDGDPVYRAYNPNDGSHFYTLSKVEFDHAVKAGWKDEGIAFRVSDGSKVALYRIYNPNSGEHFYTTSKAEVNKDVKAGWKDEGIAWNVIK